MDEARIASPALNHSEPERSTFLHTSHNGDADLLRRVEDLIQHRSGPFELTDPEITGFSQQDKPSLAGSPSQTEDLPPLTILGSYLIRGPIAQGGMGVVYRACHPDTQQEVAIKVRCPRANEPSAAQERFFREAHAAGSIRHPNVIRILEIAPEHEPPYFVMPYIAGPSLQQLLREQGPLPPDEIVRIGRDVALALQASHQAGLLHRDVKPANVLFDQQQGQAILTDFGLAYDMGDQRLTTPGMVAGTPLYMSPEQARGEPLDERSDIFSLGSLLYTLCAGRSPFQGTTAMEILRAICDATPVALHSLNPDVPPCLESLIHQMLAKDRQQRPASASLVADRLSECLDSVSASPADAGRKRSTFRCPACQPVGVLAALVVAFVIFAWQLTSQPAGTEQAAASALHSRDGSECLPPDNLRWSRIPAELKQRLGDNVNASTLVVGVLGDPVHRPQGIFTTAAYSPDGTLVALATTQGKLWLGDAKTGAAQSWPLLAHDAAIVAMTFRPDGQRLVSGGGDGHIRVWHTEKRECLQTLSVQGKVHALIYTPDAGHLLALVENQTLGSELQLWDPELGELRRSVVVTESPSRALAFSPQYNRLALGSADGRVRLVDATTFRTASELLGHQGEVRSLVFSLDGQKLFSAGEDHTVRTWDAATGEPLATFTAPAPVVCIALLDPDNRGTILAAACADGHLVICQPETVRKLHLFEEPGDSLTFVATSPDRQNFVLAGLSGTLSFRSARTPLVSQPFAGHGGPVLAVAFAPGEDRIVTLGADRVLAVWGAADGRLLSSKSSVPGEMRVLAISPSGNRLLTGSRDGKLHLWDTATLELLRTWKCSGEGGVRSVAYSPRGNCFASGDDRGGIQVWDSEGHLICGWKAGDHPIECLTFTGDGSELVSTAWDCGLRRWSPTHGDVLAAPTGAEQVRGTVCTDLENRFLAAQTRDGQVFLWYRDREKEPVQYDGSALSNLVVPQDGRYLLGHSASRGTLRLWDLTSHDGCGVEYRSPFLLSDLARPLALSPSGRFLVMGRPDGLVLILCLARPGQQPALSESGCSHVRNGGPRLAVN